MKVFDESGTEVDDDVFEDVVRDPSVGVLTIKHGAGLYLFNYSLEMYLILPINNNPHNNYATRLGFCLSTSLSWQSNRSLSSSIDSSDSQDTVIIEEKLLQ